MAFKKSLHNFTVVEAQNAALGQAGAVIIDGTDEITGPFVAVTALEDSVVDTSECDVTWLSGTVPATFKIPASGTIYGVWSARKAQMLAKQYKAKGGGYMEDGGKVEKFKKGGLAKSQKSLKQWTSEDWDYVSKGDEKKPLLFQIF